MNKSLVAFFSATGTTKKTAELIASATNADFYEILPKIPHSASDLDWMDNHSRSSMEMKDKSYCSPHPAAADLEIKELQFSAPDAILTDGKLCNHMSKKEIEEWIQSL